MTNFNYLVWCHTCKRSLSEDHDCVMELNREPLKPAQGIKHDQDKPRMELIAPEMLDALADILAFGAKKYADRNWEKGMSWGRVFGALMRHMWAWWAKKGNDPETGKSHLHHAACCLMFLIAYESRGAGQDDRV